MEGAGCSAVRSHVRAPSVLTALFFFFFFSFFSFFSSPKKLDFVTFAGGRVGEVGGVNELRSQPRGGAARSGKH